MKTMRPADARGHVDFGWLDSRHSFSFGHYHDPRHMGFRALRVINEDWIDPGSGFDAHPHRDMEILTYVLEGALKHQDSMGNGSEIRPGDLQRMTAGTGVVHSEHNASATDPVHLLQIWIEPAERGLAPGYEQKSFPPEERRGRLRLLASPDGADGSLTIHQDARLLAGELSPGDRIVYPLQPGRNAWVQVARGQVRVNGSELNAGDGMALSEEREIVMEAAPNPRGAANGGAANGGAAHGEPVAEVLLFDLA